MSESAQVEITLRDVYEKMEALEESFQDHAVDVAVAFGKRPTRLEIMTMLGGGFASIGVVLGLVRFL